MQIRRKAGLELIFLVQLLCQLLTSVQQALDRNCQQLTVFTLQASVFCYSHRQCCNRKCPGAALPRREFRTFVGTSYRRSCRAREQVPNGDSMIGSVDS